MRAVWRLPVAASSPCCLRVVEPQHLRLILALKIFVLHRQDHFVRRRTHDGSRIRAPPPSLRPAKSDGHRLPYGVVDDGTLVACLNSPINPERAFAKKGLQFTSAIAQRICAKSSRASRACSGSSKSSLFTGRPGKPSGLPFGTYRARLAHLKEASSDLSEVARAITLSRNAGTRTAAS